MELNPKSKQSDAVGDLYRSAFFMVKGQADLSFSFLEKTHSVFKEKIPIRIVDASKKKETLTKAQRFLLAEKILDQYHILKNS